MKKILLLEVWLMYPTLSSFLKAKTVLLLVLSLILQPISTQAQDSAPCEEAPCCSVCADSCCETACCWNRCTVLTIAGAAIVGAVAGAIAGRSNHHSKCHGYSGSTGPIGATGPIGPTGPACCCDCGCPDCNCCPDWNCCPDCCYSSYSEDDCCCCWTYDEGENLLFYINLIGNAPEAVTVAEGETVFMTPFVVGPDGFTIEGATIEVELLTTEIAFTPLFLNNPPFGEYEVGLKVNGDIVAELGFFGQFTAEVQASRNGSVTGLGTCTIHTSNPANAPVQTEIQCALAFDYSPLPEL